MHRQELFVARSSTGRALQRGTSLSTRCVLLGWVFWWRIRDADGAVVKVVGEYRGELFQSDEDQRVADGYRGDGLRADGWDVQEMWNSDRHSRWGAWDGCGGGVEGLR